MKKKHTFKDHYKLLSKVVEYLWDNKVVVGGIITFYGASIGSIITFILIPIAKPIVRPIIDSRWEEKVQPYDRALMNHEKRILAIEDELGLIEAME